MLNILFLLGVALLIGFAGGKAIEGFKSPHVVGFIIIGVLLGNFAPEIYDGGVIESLNVISYVALAFIGFDVGGEITFDVLRKLGKSIIWIAVLEAIGAFFVVTLAVYVFTNNISTSLIFGALASATAPAATVDVLREYRASGPLTSAIFGVVAIDDAIAITLYSVASAFARTFFVGDGLSISKLFFGPAIEIIGSILLGISVGFILHKIAFKIHDKNEQLILTLSFILITTGAAISLHLSLILANMTLGMTLINISKYGDKKSFSIISNISQPFYVLFFVLAGARLNLALIPQLGLLGLIYIVFRIIGKFGGAYAGAKISNAPVVIKKYIGLGLLSQAGVAVGLSLQALQEFSKFGDAGLQLGLLAVNVIAGTTFIFQIIGPPSTKLAIFRAGESHLKQQD